jgi:hypothetical protein
VSLSTRPASVHHNPAPSVPPRVPDDKSDGGIYTDDEEAGYHRRDAPLEPLGPPHGQTASNSHTTASGSVTIDQTVHLTTPYIQPWLHTNFAPLPRSLLSRLGQVNAAEMPVRAVFNDALVQFITTLPSGLQETAAVFPDKYAKLMQALVDETSDG